jgi:CheY-like chemotaxis protein
MKRTSFTVLMADDDPEDCLLVEDAFKEAGHRHEFFCVEDGYELIDFLHHGGKFSDESVFPFPDLILLDLNMPRKSGREALKEIREDLRFKSIPIVVLTTSSAEQDISLCYKLGANTFITKPMGFPELVDVMGSLSKYWFEIAQLPSQSA